MTSKERNELVRIVKARFKLLRSQASVRSYEIADAEQKRREQQDIADSRAFSRRMSTLNKKLATLVEQYKEVERDAQEAGFHWQGDSLPRVPQHGHFTSSHRTGRIYGYAAEKVSLAIYAEIDRAELSMVEELLVGGLESDDAKELLAQIPTFDGLASGEDILKAIEA
jgi:hypothetical protein